jgi:dihydrofolate reductase
VIIALIAALGRDRVIGREGNIPWHLSEDLRRFKRLTTGHPLVMGRKTYTSLGKPLPNRRNIVLTSQTLPGVETFRGIDEALHALATENRVFIIGGGSVYAAILPRADELFLTLVDRAVEGDTFFPPYEHLIGPVFVETAREEHEGYAFVDYRRR